MTAVLRQLDNDRTTLSVQIEGAPVRFKTRLLLKDDQVVFSKPDGIRESLRAGKHVRFRIPDDPTREIRLQVFAPQINLASGSAVFVCKLPSADSAPAKRGADRHGVAHLTNVALVMPKRDREFRLTDISLTGCRIAISQGEAKTIFPLGRPLGDVHIQVGAKAKVELASIVPRSHHPGAVGCAFTVKGEGHSQIYLKRMIETLDRA
jgi:hypothetical protein